MIDDDVVRLIPDDHGMIAEISETATNMATGDSTIEVCSDV
jgi:hypothetical protein